MFITLYYCFGYIEIQSLKVNSFTHTVYIEILYIYHGGVFQLAQSGDL